MGRQWKVSRPYDTGSSPSDWSEIAYDYLGRATTQTARITMVGFHWLDLV
ncbi:MAG: hypothetical protein JNL64_11315 [Blastocatellia bacterium]|nr:hypothetical protein [Blastocatellia bacterium]